MTLRGLGPEHFHARFLAPGSAPHRIDYLLVRGDASVRLAEPWFTEPVTLDGGQPEFVSDHVALFIHIVYVGVFIFLLTLSKGSSLLRFHTCTL
jgi:hypothetical protein